MINANELRIGNILEYNDNRERFEVLEISELGISVKSEREVIWMEFDNFSPIPLTEEILLKCGFQEHKWGLSIGKYLITASGWFMLLLNDGENVILNYHINSLHQLQNIYWCLVGEELNIQL